MSTSFTLDLHGDYIRIRLPADYEITPESRQLFWEAVGEAHKKYNCFRVLAECPNPPKRNMTQADSLKSALLAAKTSRELRVAFVFPGYVTDEITEFFITAAYNMGIRIEFFKEREKAIEWLCLNGGEDT